LPGVRPTCLPSDGLQIRGVDPLSDVLRAVRLKGAFFYVFEGTAPWAIAVAPARELEPRVLPDAEHLMAYHIVTAGSCWIGCEGDEQVQLHPGDAILFPHGDAHVASAQVVSRPAPGRYNHAPSRPLETIRLGTGGGARVNLVCGFLGCDARPYNPLLAALPRSLHVRGMAGGWLAEFPRQVVAEAWQTRAGGNTMLTRMAELMFVEVVRRYTEELSPRQAGWLAGLRDPVVAPALAALHARPAHGWTLAELARAAATSRTVLSERFSQTVGLPPMQYLTEWRLQLAAEQLATGSRKVAAVGAEVGYESEAAFSRAFKRSTGYAPAAWRRMRQGQDAVTGGADPSSRGGRNHP
jgi:AraC-like DNA-binding protein